MFKLNYIYKKRGSEYQSSYPDSGNEHHNIFIFKGSNGLGKSTIMQILAMGMFGLNSPELIPEIKNKIRGLIDEDTREFSFSFEIRSADENVHITSSMKDKNIDGLRVLLNGQPCSRTSFVDQFQLIFDIPDEITKKMNSSLAVIYKDLGDYMNYTKSYLLNIQSEYNTLKAYEQRADKLQKLEKRQAEQKAELENYDGRLKSATENHRKLRKLYVFKKFNEWDNEINLLTPRIDDLVKRVDPTIQKTKQTKFSKTKQKFLDDLKDIKSKLNDLRKSIDENEVLKQSGDLKSLLSGIDKYNNSNDFSESFFDRNIRTLIGLTQTLADDERNKPTKDENELELLESIISVLKNYVSINPEIPGTNGKSLNQFLDELEFRKSSLNDKLSEKKKFLLLEKRLSELKDSFVSFKNIWKRISSVEVENKEDASNLKKELEELTDRRENLYKKLSEIVDEYNLLSDSERLIEYDLIDEEEYEKSRSEVEDLYNKIQKVKDYLKITNSLLDDYNGTSVDPPKYSKETLDHLSKVASGIQAKLYDWSKSFGNMNGTIILDKINISASAIAFYDALGKYLANILEYIFHNGERYALKKIDLIAETFIVENGDPIKFYSISTGFNALNSLLAKIKQDYGGRKKILLLDEIGIMDDRNTDILLSEIKKQVKEGKVLFAALNRAEKDLDHIVVEGID